MEEEEEVLQSSKINMGLVLKEKEKALIDILSRHPSLNNRLDVINEKINLNIILSKSMRSRTSRYDENINLSSSDNNNLNNSFNSFNNFNNNNNNENNDIERYRKSAIDLETIVEQTLIDMESLKNEKKEIIENLNKEIEKKNKQLEESIDRFTMLKHYANLLIKSSNIYVHKNIEEIQESDKVINY